MAMWALATLPTGLALMTYDYVCLGYLVDRLSTRNACYVFSMCSLEQQYKMLQADRYRNPAIIDNNYITLYSYLIYEKPSEAIMNDRSVLWRCINMLSIANEHPWIKDLDYLLLLLLIFYFIFLCECLYFNLLINSLACSQRYKQ